MFSTDGLEGRFSDGYSLVRHSRGPGTGSWHCLIMKFQKADSDLDYLQYRLEYEIKTNHPHSAGEKNAGAILKELSAIKSRYQALAARFKEVSVEQKETKSCICAILNKTMTMIQELQKQTNLELTLLTEEEKAVTEQLKSHMPDLF